MTAHQTALVLLGLIGIFWLQAVLTIGVFFVKGTHRPQVHHFYFGAVAVVFSHSPWLWPVGLLFALDDAVQHTIQERHPSYLSPLHRAYEWVYRHLPHGVQRCLDAL